MRRPVLESFGRGAVGLPSLQPRASLEINRRRKAGAIVAIAANGKGGCGKSTLLLNAGVGYCRQGKRVLIVDADVEQRTIGKWPRPKDVAGPAIIICPTAEVVERVASVIGSYDVVLVDLPGRDDRAIVPLMDVADILISPTKPSVQDLNELGRYLRVAEARRLPHVVVVNEANRETTNEVDRLRESFARFAPFLRIAMQQLSTYRRIYAYGRGVLELSNPDPARENFRRVFEELSAVVSAAHARRVSELS